MNPDPETSRVESMAAVEIKNIEKWAAGELFELANADGISAKDHLERLRHLEYVISHVVRYVKTNAVKTNPGAA